MKGKIVKKKSASKSQKDNINNDTRNLLVYLVYDLDFTIIAASKLLLQKYVTAKQILKKFRDHGSAERTNKKPHCYKNTKTQQYRENLFKGILAAIEMKNLKLK